MAFMVLYGPFMTTYRFGLVWSSLSVIDPNQFGLWSLVVHGVEKSIQSENKSCVWDRPHTFFLVIVILVQPSRSKSPRSLIPTNLTKVGHFENIL